MGIQSGDREGSTIDWPGIAEYVLSEVQDAIARSTTEPWPEIVENGRRAMAMPDASVLDGTVSMWFGEQAARFCGSIPCG